MSMAGLKITLKSYLGFNYFYAGVIAFSIFAGLFLILRKKCNSTNTDICAKDIVWRLILAIYIALLIGGTLMNRKVSDIYEIKWAPFWSYRQLMEEHNFALAFQMVHNVLVFIPWPILFEKISQKMNRFAWGVGSAFLFSAFIETTQLIFRCGFFEFDDIFHNALGALIGYAFLRIYRLKHPVVSRSDSETTIQGTADNYENET